MGLFERDTEIYKNRDALREDYQPAQLVGRDEEIQMYQTALQPVINGEQPNNVFLYGKTGVGKTAATRYLLSHLEEDASQYDDIDLHLTFLNCDGLTSSYQIATRLVNELRDETNQISTTGYPRATVYEMLWEDLDETAGTNLIVLDEVDHVEDDSILYQLPRARANNNLSAAKIGIIGISNDFSFRDDLSPKVKSSLCEQEIHFPAYDAGDLQKILEQRAAVAFHEDVLDDAVIPLCAAYGAKDAGDARQSIDLLMKAGDLAREEEETVTVTETHVEAGRHDLERGRIEEGISGLTQHGHLVLYSLLTLHLQDETPIRSRDVRPRYTSFAQRAGRDPLVPRRMRDHLSELAMLGLVSVTERNEGRRGGTYREYTLDMDLDLILSALDDVLNDVGVHDSLQGHLAAGESTDENASLTEFN
ncbi:orc1/cdc6 family replication initiation protein [Natronorubrum thiooxidans]|uniref:ORC1-type DNA replication protein n=1 Tax=Natronorubrum thiooxidans TaxID=308853 RepID=A0A1N7H510_9EURY|nr:orc1/cdc6 family replication initiation protein [Natronorubrum thiooxidans]SIS19944.1 ORC complex protein Cdc6/Orc1 [Natronorubrum thiooxidans]